MKTNGQLLDEKLTKLMRDGEIPYQANRRAVQSFDIFLDNKAGKRELIVMIEGIDVLISDLEDLSNVSEKVDMQLRNSIR